MAASTYNDAGQFCRQTIDLLAEPRDLPPEIQEIASAALNAFLALHTYTMRVARGDSPEAARHALEGAHKALKHLDKQNRLNATAGSTNRASIS